MSATEEDTVQLSELRFYIQHDHPLSEYGKDGYDGELPFPHQGDYSTCLNCGKQIVFARFSAQGEGEVVWRHSFNGWGADASCNYSFFKPLWATPDPTMLYFRNGEML